MTKLITTLKKCFFLIFLWFVIHVTCITLDGMNDDAMSEKPVVGIIFGTTVHKDGSLSDRLKSRLDKGLLLYKSGLIDTFFVSGGHGLEGHDEGSKMSDYLIIKGVPKDHIVVDNKGNNSRLTALNFIAKFPETRKVVVITQFYHVTRAKLALRQVGEVKAVGAGADNYFIRDLYGLFREFFAYYKYLIFY